MKRYIKSLSICILVLASLILVSCGKSDEIDDKAESKIILLASGAIVENNNGEYNNFQYNNGKYSIVDEDETVALYDYKSNNYISIKNGKYIANYNNKSTELNEIGIYDNSFNLSPGGKYLSFFRNEEYNQLHVLDMQSGKMIELKMKVSISGKYIDWLDEDTLIYYGVKTEDKTNGIFIYDIESGKENLFLKINEGYIEFIKTLDNGIVYSLGDFEGEKQLIKISPDGSDPEVLSTDIMKIYDIVELNGTYYILGNFKDTDYALYKLEDGVHRRLTYAYPTTVNIKKGLVKTDEGNILFIGSNNSEMTEEIYKVDGEGAVSLVQDGTNEINFIRRYTING